MTGKELLEKLQELPEEDLQVNIFVFESGHRYARELDSMEVRKVLGDTAYILLRYGV